MNVQDSKLPFDIYYFPSVCLCVWRELGGGCSFLEFGPYLGVNFILFLIPAIMNILVIL